MKAPEQNPESSLGPGGARDVVPLSAAQLQIGDNLKMNVNGNIGFGYGGEFHRSRRLHPQLEHDGVRNRDGFILRSKLLVRSQYSLITIAIRTIQRRSRFLTILE